MFQDNIELETSVSEVIRVRMMMRHKEAIGETSNDSNNSR